jgi:hypothetical protein
LGNIRSVMARADHLPKAPSRKRYTWALKARQERSWHRPEPTPCGCQAGITSAAPVPVRHLVFGTNCPTFGPLSPYDGRCQHQPELRRLLLKQGVAVSVRVLTLARPQNNDCYRRAP